MKLPKLLIITSSYYPNIGGVENHVRAVAKRLTHYKPIILVRFSDNLPARQLVDGIEIYRLPKNLNRLGLSLWVMLHWRVISRPSVIHSHDLFVHFFRRFFKNVFWVHTFHGFEGYPLRQEAIQSRIEIRREVNYCFGIGKFIEKWYGTRCDDYLYGAAETSGYNGGLKKIWDGVFFGRLETDTGFRAYLESMVGLEQTGNYRFCVVGDGSELDWAKDYCSKNGSKVEFIGKQPSVLKDISRAKVAFVSGYLGIIEAAALKLPIVGYYDNPLKHDYLRMHPQASNMYLAKNQEEIEKAFVSALKPDQKKLTEFQYWAKAQTWEKIAQKYLEIYAKA